MTTIKTVKVVFVGTAGRSWGTFVMSFQDYLIYLINKGYICVVLKDCAFFILRGLVQWLCLGLQNQ